VLIKQHVDALGLICPAPLLMTRVALNNIAIGECVEVLCSDASSVNDFHRLIELTQHRMMTFEAVNKCLCISQKSVDQSSVDQKNADQANINQDIEIHYRYVLKKGQ
jgi:TusA-related sulfurtransferase